MPGFGRQLCSNLTFSSHDHNLTIEKWCDSIANFHNKTRGSIEDPSFIVSHFHLQSKGPKKSLLYREFTLSKEKKTKTKFFRKKI